VAKGSTGFWTKKIAEKMPPRASSKQSPKTANEKLETTRKNCSTRGKEKKAAAAKKDPPS